MGDHESLPLHLRLAARRSNDVLQRKLISDRADDLDAALHDLANMPSRHNMIVVNTAVARALRQLGPAQ